MHPNIRYDNTSSISSPCSLQYFSLRRAFFKIVGCDTYRQWINSEYDTFNYSNSRKQMSDLTTEISLGLGCQLSYYVIGVPFILQ